jgi:Uma2 family endonuclease
MKGGILAVMDRPHHTIEDYVKLEEFSNLKHEYLDGQIYAMGGGTLEHARLAMAIGRQLGNQLEGRRCAIYSSDARVRVQQTGLDTYPDITIACSPPEVDTEDPLAQVNPTVLVEVTSKSSEKYDRGAKFEHYKRIPSLREYVVVSHREPAIDVFRRGEDGTWSLAERGGAGAQVTVASLGCTLDVDPIYRDPLR